MHNIKKRITEELESFDKMFENRELDEHSVHTIKELCKTLYYVDLACKIMEHKEHVKGSEIKHEKKEVELEKGSYL